MRPAFLFFFSIFRVHCTVYPGIYSQHIQLQLHHRDKNRISVFQRIFFVNQILTKRKLILRGIRSTAFHVELRSFQVRTTRAYVETVLLVEMLELDEK